MAEYINSVVLFFLKRFLFYFMGVLPTCISMHSVSCAECVCQRGIRSPGIGVRDACESSRVQ